MFSSVIQKSAGLVCLWLGLAACSPEGLIRDAELSSSVQQGDLYVGLKTRLDAANIQMISAQIPILNPDNPAEMIGRLSISTLSPGITEMELLFNFSRVSQLPRLKPEGGLPNGTAFPVHGVSPQNWYSLPLGNSGRSRMYLNLDLGAPKVVVGYALSSEALNAGLLANLFTGYQGQGFVVYGGIYSGPLPGQSGVAVFGDVTYVLTGKSEGAVSFYDGTSAQGRRNLGQRILDLNRKNSVLKFR